jgi:UDP-2,3-diacylglucosamine hydrolase
VSYGRARATPPAGDAMSVLFISDLHLCEERPATTRAFRAFLAGPARAARTVYILGDLFEYWVGDDDGEAPFNRQVSEALAALAASGVDVFLLAGNRDFLVGERFARQAGLRLLADPTLIELTGRRVLLTHGDTLCTDDRAYQAYRVQVRDAAWQRSFLARPLSERRHIVEDLRRRSEAAKRDKASEIMDVNGGAVDALLREWGYPTLIHGHTHRPARHLHEVDGHPCERWVLADWDDDAPYLAWGASGPEAQRYRPPSD